MKGCINQLDCWKSSGTNCLTKAWEGGGDWEFQRDSRRLDDLANLLKYAQSYLHLINPDYIHNVLVKQGNTDILYNSA